MPSRRQKHRKKHQRRTAKEIDRSYTCPYEGCARVYGSEGSLNLHMKIKHNGGTKTDREKLARQLIEAITTAEGASEAEGLRSIQAAVDLNLPPGTLEKIASEKGLP